MLELVEQTEVAIDEVIQVMGRATIEAVLEMSAEGVAGVKQAGRSRAEDDTVWYGRQGGVVYLSDRKVRVERPRSDSRSCQKSWDAGVGLGARSRSPVNEYRSDCGCQKTQGWGRFVVVGSPCSRASRPGWRGTSAGSRL